MPLFGGVEITGQPDLDNVRKLDLLPIPMIRRMGRYGMAIDPDYFRALGSQFEREMAELQRDISAYIPPEHLDKFVEQAGRVEADAEEGGYDGGVEINAASGDQIGKLLFELLGVGEGKKLKRTKGGKISTGKAQLRDLEREHPAVSLVLQYRERAKLLGTYCTGLVKRAVWHPRSECCPVCELKHWAGTWRVHTHITTTRTETGRLASKNPNCFDGETEVLTPAGWVAFNSLSEYLPVAQWEDGKIEFVMPTEYIRGRSSDMRRITSEHIDLFVTANHRCLLQTRRSGRLKVFTPDEYPEDLKQINSGMYAGEGISLSDWQIRFMIALQADGSWRDNGELDFSFSKDRKIERFLDILEAAGLEFTMSNDGSRHRFYVRRCPFLIDLKYRMGKEKLFRWEDFLGMNTRQAAIAMEEVMLWDGNFTTRTGYCSKHKHNCDIVATLFTLNGIRSVVLPFVNNAGREYWMAWVSKNGYSMTTNCVKESVPGEHQVYCVSVPSSYILVRRGGKTMVTGNCQNIPSRGKLGAAIRAGFIATPGTKLVTTDFSQIELRMMAHLSNCKSMVDVYNHDGDIHEQTAMQCFGIPDRSLIDKVSHRIPSKVANFLCIAEGQRVLTNVGLVDIDRVQNYQLVWDGQEYVRHEGVVFKGMSDVICYDGLAATPDHKVWTIKGVEVTMEEAARNELYLMQTGVGTCARDFGYVSGLDFQPNIQWSVRKNVRVFDILNAGPRNRFTVEGKLVSNCLYGGSGKALYAQLLMAMLILISEKKLDSVPGWLTEEWCEVFVEKWFAGRPEVKEYMDLQAYRARRYGLVWTIFGFCRLVPELSSHHRWIREAGVRQAGNVADQGSCAGLMKLVMGRLEQDMCELREDKPDGSVGGGVWCWPLVTVHDELIVEVQEDAADQMLELMTYRFDTVMDDVEIGERMCRVPIKSDGKVMLKWEKG